MNDYALTDITSPTPLALEEIPALQHCDEQFCKFNPAEASAIITGAHALICNLIFERDTYRDGFEARNARGGITKLAPIKRAEEMLARQRPQQMQEGRRL